MKKSASLSSYLTTYLPLFLRFALPFLGFCAGVVIWNSVVERENFVQWKQLDSPLKFATIEDANAFTVWARATDDKLYFWGFYCEPSTNTKCNQWIATDDVPNDAHDDSPPPIEKHGTCPVFYDKQPKGLPPGKIVECTLGIYGIKGTYYALLEDGTIWYQPLPIPNDTIDPRILIYPCGGLLLGLVVARLIVAIIRHLSSDSKWFWRS